MTFRPYKVCPFIVTTSRLQFNQVSKPGCHRPHWTSSNWKMSPSCQVARTIQIGLQWCLYMDPYNGCIRRFELWKQMPQVHWVEHQVVSSTCFPPALSSFIISLIGRWEINIYTPVCFHDSNPTEGTYLVINKPVFAYRVTTLLTRTNMDRKGRWHGVTPTSLLTRFCFTICT